MAEQAGQRIDLARVVAAAEAQPPRPDPVLASYGACLGFFAEQFGDWHFEDAQLACLMISGRLGRCYRLDVADEAAALALLDTFQALETTEEVITEGLWNRLLVTLGDDVEQASWLAHFLQPERYAPFDPRSFALLDGAAARVRHVSWLHYLRYCEALRELSHSLQAVRLARLLRSQAPDIGRLAALQYFMSRWRE